MNTLVDCWNITFAVLLGCSGVVGLLALISPKVFAVVASHGNSTIYKGVETSFDRNWIDIDRYVFAHGRMFGITVSFVTGYLWCISSLGPDTYSKSFSMIIVAVALMMGLFALRHIVQQSGEIKLHLTAASTDPLTGLSNRRVFDRECARQLAQHRSRKTPVCLLTVDVDNFKAINDNFGHPTGDAILKNIANNLAAAAQPLDVALRMGGDEFALLLPGCSLQQASRGAERLRNTIVNSPVCDQDVEHSVTVSIGMAESRFGDTVESLLERADSALYAAKQTGKNRASCGEAAHSRV